MGLLREVNKLRKEVEELKTTVNILVDGAIYMSEMHRNKDSKTHSDRKVAKNEST